MRFPISGGVFASCIKLAGLKTSANCRAITARCISGSATGCAICARPMAGIARNATRAPIILIFWSFCLNPDALTLIREFFPEPRFGFRRARCADLPAQELLAGGRSIMWMSGFGTSRHSDGTHASGNAGYFQCRFDLIEGGAVVSFEPRCGTAWIIWVRLGRSRCIPWTAAHPMASAPAMAPPRIANVDPRFRGAGRSAIWKTAKVPPAGCEANLASSARTAVRPQRGRPAR